eukprot:COSAG04_NODE_16809_length_488_cov_0.904884_1_plen_58_part_01
MRQLSFVCLGAQGRSCAQSSVGVRSNERTQADDATKRILSTGEVELPLGHGLRRAGYR